MANAVKRGKTFSAVWELPRINGKRKQAWQSGFPTKKGALHHAQEEEKKIRDGDYVPAVKLTVSTYMERWLADYVAPRSRPRTVEGYRGLVSRYLKRTIGGLELQHLTAPAIQALYGQLLTKGRTRPLSPRTVLHLHRMLKEALSWAVRWQLITRNPADAVAPPSAQRHEPAVLTFEGAFAILNALEGSEYAPVVTLALYSGLRRGELCGLRWQDVDLDQGALYVSQTIQRVKGAGLVTLAPKTERSRRRVSLAPKMIAMLKAHKAAQNARRLECGPLWQDNGLVFTNSIGRPRNPDKLTAKFAQVARDLNLPGLRLHDLRHAHASFLLAQGVHAKIVSERLGHANINITLDTYSHVLPGLQEHAAQVFEDSLEARLANG